jgi:5'-3' exonuclease
MSNVTLIIDGDVIAHGACRNRWGSTKEAALTFTAEQDELYLLECLQNTDRIIKQLEETTFASKTLIAVKGENNFRQKIFPPYKAHRKTRLVNTFVDLVREYLVSNGKAIAANGMEADDLLYIWRNEALENGELPIIASIDKDLLCIPGKHYRFPRGNLYEAGSRDPGLIIEVGEFDAAYNYHLQLLMGDSTDGIPGLPQVGKVRAAAILSDCKTLADLQFMVCYAYKGIIGEKWKEALMLTGQLISILPHRDFKFSIDGWNGVENEK